jgi:hypothetical protein
MAELSGHSALCRRALLQLLAVGCAAMPLWAVAAVPSNRAAVDARRRLVGIVAASRSATALAARLRRSFDTLAALEHAFAVELARLRDLAAAPISDTRLGIEIKRMIEADFAAGRALRLDGWVLSRTELALCHAAAGAAPESAAPS